MNYARVQAHHCTKQAAGVDCGCLVFTAAAITITSDPVLDDQFDLHLNQLVKVSVIPQANHLAA